MFQSSSLFKIPTNRNINYGTPRVLGMKTKIAIV